MRKCRPSLEPNPSGVTPRSTVAILRLASVITVLRRDNPIELRGLLLVPLDLTIRIEPTALGPPDPREQRRPKLDASSTYGSVSKLEYPTACLPYAEAS